MYWPTSGGSLETLGAQGIELISVQASDFGLTGSLDTQWRYDVRGNIVGAAILNPSNESVLLTINNGQPERVTCSAGKVEAVVRVIRASSADGPLLTSQDMIPDLEEETRILLGDDCSLFN